MSKKSKTLGVILQAAMGGAAVRHASCGARPRAHSVYRCRITEDSADFKMVPPLASARQRGGRLGALRYAVDGPSTDKRRPRPSSGLHHRQVWKANSAYAMPSCGQCAREICKAPYWPTSSKQREEVWETISPPGC